MRPSGQIQIVKPPLTRHPFSRKLRPMPNALEVLETLDLALPDESGALPKPSRLSSASTVRDLYSALVREDENSSRARVRVQAMVDGEPPYNQAALNASGMGSRANANFLMGRDLITKTNNGYLDIITSAKQLMTLVVEAGEPSERIGYARIIAEELTRTIRKWNGFRPAFMRLVDMFNTHGVGVEYSIDSTDFRFDVTGLSEFMVPRQVPLDEDRTPYAILRRDLTVTDLYDFIENEKVAKSRGWNPDAVMKAISRATTKGSNGEIGELEQLQRQIKNNDIFTYRKFAHVALLYIWVREFDGSISLFITEKDAPDGDFLFKGIGLYEDASDAFNYYCYGVGNGTLHGVRGLGHMLYALVQLDNRLMCQSADGEMLRKSIMVKSETGNALQEMSLNYLGPFSLMSPGLEVVSYNYSGAGDTGLMDEVKSRMGTAAARFATISTQDGQPYQNKDATNLQMESQADGDSGAIDMFYASLDRTIRRMCKRIVRGPKSDKLVREFHQRVERRGITKEILDSIDHDSTYAYRTVGAGSPAARALAWKNLMQLLPQLDEIGRRNLIYEFVADQVGPQIAEEFASKAETPRFNTEAGVALLENELLLLGRPIPVLPEQMHATHVQMHIPKLVEVLDAVERGEADPMELLSGLNAALNHIAAHGEAVANDPTQKAVYSQVKEVVNNIRQIVTNMERKIKAEQRKAAEAGTPESPAAPDLSAEMEEIKLATARLKYDIALRKGDLELAAMQAKADQNLALNDIKARDMVLKKLNFPRSDYSQRR